MIGPADRELFFAAQRRHRRAARRYSALCALAALVLATAASVVLSPLVILAAALAVRVLRLALPVPAVVGDLVHPLLASYRQLGSALGDFRLAPDEVIASLQSVGLLLVPGVVAILLLWLVVRGLLFHAGVGEAASSARHAARRRRCQRRGRRLVDARRDLVVSRRLLDELDRDRTQGILGQLIASVGNGDLRILLTFLSVAQTFGVVMALLDAPMSQRARATFWRMLTLLPVWRWRTTAPPLAALVAAMLVGRTDLDAVQDTLEPVEIIERPSTTAAGRVLRYAQFFLLLPVILLSLEAKLLLFLFTLLVVGPLTWLALRRRRYLADATAVQLTRNPDGLAGGLIALAERGGGTPGGALTELLFVVGGADAGATAPDFIPVPPPRRRRVASSSVRPADSDELPLFLLGARPAIGGRLARLKTLGARIPAAAGSHAEAAAVPPPISAAATTAGGTSSGVLTWLLAVPVIGVVLLAAGAVVFYGAAFVLYLFLVGVIGALIVLGAVHVVVMELVARLL